MVCHISSGLKVKLKSSCGAGRLDSPEHCPERNLETQDAIKNISADESLCVRSCFLSLLFNTLIPTNRFLLSFGESVGNWTRCWFRKCSSRLWLNADKRSIWGAGKEEGICRKHNLGSHRVTIYTIQNKKSDRTMLSLDSSLASQVADQTVPRYPLVTPKPKKYRPLSPEACLSWDGELMGYETGRLSHNSNIKN